MAAVGLVEEGDGWLRMHRLLVHFVRQKDLDLEAHSAVDGALIGCGDDAAEGYLAGSALAAVIPHLIEAAVRVGTGDEHQAAEVWTAAGRTLQSASDLRAAKSWYERALAIRERMLGPDHAGTAESLSNLANFAVGAGRTGRRQTTP